MSRHSSLIPRFSSLIIDHWTSIIANGSLILIGLVLAAPLLQNAALCTDDGALHLYRTVALDRALHGEEPRFHFPDDGPEPQPYPVRTLSRVLDVEHIASGRFDDGTHQVMGPMLDRPPWWGEHEDVVELNF